MKSRKSSAVDDAVIRAMIKDEWVNAHRHRALTPDNPVLRGTAQNPDVYFQARESVNPFYQALPAIMQAAMDRFAGADGPPLPDYSNMSVPHRRNGSLFSWVPARKPWKKPWII